MAPIRKEWRRFYRGAAWEAARRRILERAGGKFDEKGKYLGGARCEACLALDRSQVIAASGYHWETVTELRSLMVWREVDGTVWRTNAGELAMDVFGKVYELDLNGPRVRLGEIRTVLVQIGVAHLDRTPGHDTDDNLKALCRWCHLHYDRPQHKETRAERKDRMRPMLEACADAIARTTGFEVKVKGEGLEVRL